MSIEDPFRFNLGLFILYHDKLVRALIELISSISFLALGQVCTSAVSGGGREGNSLYKFVDSSQGCACKVEKPSA